MRPGLSSLPAALLLGIAAAVPAQNRPDSCASSDHHAFDFWIGEWNVHGADGKLSGTNSIQREIGGCVLHERYKTDRGYSGKSFNLYDATRRVWHQTWVDSTGALLVLEGGMRDGSMVLEGQSTGADGKLSQQRITWTPNPDGSVRQLWEATNPAGEWTVAFDGKYTRKP